MQQLPLRTWEAIRVSDFASSFLAFGCPPILPLSLKALWDGCSDGRVTRKARRRVLAVCNNVKHDKAEVDA